MKLSKDTYVNLPFVNYPYATSAIIQRYEKISRDTDKAEIFLDTDKIPLPDENPFAPHRKSLDNESKVIINSFKDLPSQILIGVNLEDGDLPRLISKFTQKELIEQTLENFHKVNSYENDETYPAFERLLDLSYDDIENGNFNLQALIEDETTEPFCSAICTPNKDNEPNTELIIGISDGSGTELTWSVPLDLDEEIMLENEMYRRIDVETFQNIIEDDRINDGLFVKEYYIEGGNGWSSECDSYGEIFGNTLPSDSREALDMLNEAEFFFNDKCIKFLASKGIDTDTERNWYNFSTQWGDDDGLMGKLRITDKENGEEHIKEISFTDEEKCRFESILERYLKEELKEAAEENKQFNMGREILFIVNGEEIKKVGMSLVGEKLKEATQDTYAWLDTRDGKGIVDNAYIIACPVAFENEIQKLFSEMNLRFSQVSSPLNKDGLTDCDMPYVLKTTYINCNILQNIKSAPAYVETYLPLTNEQINDLVLSRVLVLYGENDGKPVFSTDQLDTDDWINVYARADCHGDLKVFAQIDSAFSTQSKEYEVPLTKNEKNYITQLMAQRCERDGYDINNLYKEINKSLKNKTERE